MSGLSYSHHFRELRCMGLESDLPPFLSRPSCVALQSWRTMFRPMYRPMLYVTSLIAFFQQFTGERCLPRY